MIPLAWQIKIFLQEHIVKIYWTFSNICKTIKTTPNEMHIEWGQQSNDKYQLSDL